MLTKQKFWTYEDETIYTKGGKVGGPPIFLAVTIALHGDPIFGTPG